ncbi:MAG: HU family DNA-binding protein [Gammaproteobacteria bacterium]|nr:HU family DNA-binding protein [Gammaproteobacteria bacterium]
MKKTELIDYVVENVEGLSKVLAKKVVEAVFDGIAHGLKNDELLSIIGHGVYQVGNRSERTGLHPQTGKPMVIPATKVIKFRAGKALKDEINKAK